MYGWYRQGERTSRWRHDMETLPALSTPCAEETTRHRWLRFTKTRNVYFNVFFVLRLNKLYRLFICCADLQPNQMGCSRSYIHTYICIVLLLMLWYRETHINPRKCQEIVEHNAGIELTTFRFKQRRQLPVRQHVCFTWWRHQMETFSALLAICARNSPVPGEFPTQRPVTRSFDVYFDLRPNKRLSKQSWGWWFETLSPHFDVIVMTRHRDCRRTDYPPKTATWTWIGPNLTPVFILNRALPLAIHRSGVFIFDALHVSYITYILCCPPFWAHYLYIFRCYLHETY